jgi:hypothetical protein
MKLWPKNANDAAGAEALLAHGWPTLAPVLKDIVDGTRTAGSIRPLFCKFLGELGEPAVEHVRLALAQRREEQSLALLRDALPAWPRPALLAVADELAAWLHHPSHHGLHLHALALLIQARAEIHTPAHEWAAHFRQRLNEQREALDRVCNALRATPANGE